MTFFKDWLVILEKELLVVQDLLRGAKRDHQKVLLNKDLKKRYVHLAFHSLLRQKREEEKRLTQRRIRAVHRALQTANENEVKQYREEVAKIGLFGRQINDTSREYIIFQELKRTEKMKSTKIVQSSLLHGVNQSFKQNVLQKQLLQALDETLKRRMQAVEKSLVDKFKSITQPLTPQLMLSTTKGKKSTSVQEESKRVMSQMSTLTEEKNRRNRLRDQLKRLVLENVELTTFPVIEDDLFSCTVLNCVKQGRSRYFTRKILHNALQDEMFNIKRKLRLIEIDDELLRVSKIKVEFTTTRVLQGHKQVQWKSKIIDALKREQRDLIIQQVADEFIPDLVDWMHEGWIFGEFDDKSEEFVKFKHDQITNVEKIEDAIAQNGREEMIQKIRDEQAEHQSKMDEDLKESKFHMLFVVLAYFQAIYASNETLKPRKTTKLKNRQKRHQQNRELLKETKIPKLSAKKGMRRVRKRVAVVKIQMIWRGFKARQGLQQRKKEKKLKDLIKERNIFCATRVQSVFRGNIGRRLANDKRLELTEYLRYVMKREQAELEFDRKRKKGVKRFIYDHLSLLRGKRMTYLDEIDEFD